MSYEYRDPIYGDIVLSEDEARLIDTYEMQRLRHIRQLGNVHLVFHGANHTRFEHSLGTRWLVQKIVRISNLPINRFDEKILYKSALLHDIAEPAFAHATERLSILGLPTHEQIIDYVLDGVYKEKVLEKKDVDCRFVCDVLNNEEKQEIRAILSPNIRRINKPFIRELIKGYIDADNLDYLRRDSFYLGLPYGNYDDRIFTSFRIAKHEGDEHIAFRDSEDTLSAIMSILDSRYVLRKTAYLHHTVIIADDMLLNALKSALSGKDSPIDPYDIFICGDLELLYKIIFKAKERQAPYLIDRLLYRTLNKRLYILDNQSPSEIKEKAIVLEADWEKRSNLETQLSQDDHKQIMLNFAPTIGWKDFNLILLVNDNGVIKTLGEKLPGDISLLKTKYESLWRFMISGNIEGQEERDAASATCINYFGHIGSFEPKKSFYEIDDIKSRVSKSIEELKKQQSIIDILKLLRDKNKPVSRDEIAKELELKPSTVSHYLKMTENKIGSKKESLLLSTREGRLKFWWIDKRLKEVLDYL
jgi:uncharacterized protein